MSSQNLLAMEGGVPFSPKKAFADDGGAVVARVSVDIEHVVLAGAVTSICIDSTGRAAHERNYSVTILTDGTASRTPFEQSFYCENVFPLYANSCTVNDFLTEAESSQ